MPEMSTQVIMVRNLRSAPVGRTMISATARDVNGTLAALGSSYLPVPAQMPDDGLSIMRVLFYPPQLPEGATVEYEASNLALA